jgi:hypothetical protein
MEATLIPIFAALTGGIVTSVLGWMLATRERSSKIQLMEAESHQQTIQSLSQLLEDERENTDRQKRAKRECWQELEKLKARQNGDT